MKQHKRKYKRIITLQSSHTLYFLLVIPNRTTYIIGRVPHYHYYKKGFSHRAILTFHIGSGPDVNTVDVESLTHFTSGQGPMWKRLYHIGYSWCRMWNVTFNYILFKTNVHITSGNNLIRCEISVFGT
jgi:hypothetical protein